MAEKPTEGSNPDNSFSIEENVVLKTQDKKKELNGSSELIVDSESSNEERSPNENVEEKTPSSEGSPIVEEKPDDHSSPEEIETNQDHETNSIPEIDEKALEEKRKRDAELNNYWKAVDDNPMDFTSWTYLLQYVEQGVEIEDSRKAFEAFFSHYPYCYGYWKKYSDVEKKNGNLQRAMEVFEKGLRAIPLSVELWLHYVNFYTAEFSSRENFIPELRSLFKRALAAAGLDFRSDKLWDSYINWENSNGDLKAVTSIYEKLIATPTQLYSHHWDNFCQHIKENSPWSFLDSETFLKIRLAVVTDDADHVYDEEEDGGTEDKEDEKEDAPPGSTPLMENGKEVKKIRAHYLETVEKIHKANEIEISTRWTFEETIRRPYFHVKPLERGQLKNWRDYLDFEISTGNHKRIVVLFERCMIACALYEDFWMKYAKYLEQHSIDGVRSVYQRACDIHLPKKPYIHLAWAAFEERKDNYPLARKILMNIENNMPGLAMVCMRRISLERRKGNHEAAEELFKAYIQRAVSQKARTFFSLKYARYLQKILGNFDKARSVLMDTLDLENINERVFLQLLDLEYQAQPVDEEQVHNIFDMLFKSNVSVDFKIKVSQRRMEFLEDFGTCIQKISDAYEEHQKLLKEAGPKKKRPEKERSSEEPPDKKTKTSESAPTHPSTTTNHFPPSVPTSGHQTTSAPQPPPQADSTYSYGQQWTPNTSYPNNATYPSAGYPTNTTYPTNTSYPNSVPNMYPGYQYPQYPQQPQPPQQQPQQQQYGYYSYQ